MINDFMSVSDLEEDLLEQDKKLDVGYELVSFWRGCSIDVCMTSGYWYAMQNIREVTGLENTRVEAISSLVKFLRSNGYE